MGHTAAVAGGNLTKFPSWSLNHLSQGPHMALGSGWEVLLFGTLSFVSFLLLGQLYAPHQIFLKRFDLFIFKERERNINM